MNQRLLATISILIVAVLVIGGVLYVKLKPSQQLQNASVAPAIGTSQAGQLAPEFSAATTAGLFDLAKTNKPVFLEVFATWCPHCQRETAVIDKLYNTYKSRVDFIAIPGSDTAMDGTSPSSQLDVLNFQQKLHAEYPIAAYDPSLTVANKYLMGGFPTIAVIGKDKKVSYINSGEISYSELQREIERALKA
jgi:thiol-disulfide isomerase/thioredoxin